MAQETEIGTFSAAVDRCITDSARIDKITTIQAFLRTSIRELQVQEDVCFMQDFVEDSITNVQTDPYIFPIPANYRKMQYVRYPAQTDLQYNVTFAKPVLPSRNSKLDSIAIYYRSGQSVIFGGTWGTSTTPVQIDIGYFQYSPPLAYFSIVTDRPARFILETQQWVYAASVANTDAAREIARNQVSNWLLQNWFDQVVEGCLHKLYKLIGDQRAASSYSLFTNVYKLDVLQGESRQSVT